jgi:hypothetical protein
MKLKLVTVGKQETKNKRKKNRKTAFRFDRRTTKTGTHAKLGEISPTNRCKGKQ